MVKPKVAFALEAKARANLDRKITRLEALLKAGALPPDAPSSLNEFNAWEFAGEGEEESFKSNGHETLSRHSDLKAAAEALTGFVKKASKPVPRPRAIGLKRAREQADLHRRLRQIAERHALRIMAENATLRAEREALQTQVESMAEETARIREEYEEEMLKLRTRNAELLRARPSNVKALRGHE